METAVETTVNAATEMIGGTTRWQSLKYTAVLVRFIFVTFGAIWIYNWIRNNRISVPCMACERGGFATKCMAGTGHGSQGCEQYKKTLAELQEIRDQIPKIKLSAQEIMDKFEGPIESIKQTIAQINNYIASVDLSVPDFPTVQFPEFSEFDLTLDFSKLGSIDPCKDIIQPAINAAISPYNAAINSTRSRLTSSLTDINKALKDLGLKEISMNVLDEIKSVALSCNVDLAAEFKKIGLDKINIGKIISTRVKYALTIINKGLQIAQQSINKMFEIVATVMEYAMRELGIMLRQVAMDLKKQMETLNVFKDLIPEIKTLTFHIGQLDLGRVLEIYVLPTIQGWFPGASLGDIMLAVFTVMLISFVVYLWNYASLVLQPASDAISIAMGPEGLGGMFASEYKPASPITSAIAK